MSGTASGAHRQPALGQVEGLVGATVLGWTTRVQAAPADVVITDGAGTILAQAQATQPRPDLAPDAAGFRVTLPDFGSTPVLRALVNGQELPGSPITAGPAVFDGAVAINGGTAEGWVHARALPFAPPRIRLFDQTGLCLGETQAVAGRAEGPFRPARFRLDLPAASFRHRVLLLRAAAGGSVFATTEATFDLDGVLETATHLSLRGWIRCPQAPEPPLGLEIRRNGVLLAVVPANLPRTDVPTGQTTPPNCGFDLALPKPLGPDAPFTLSIRLAGTTREAFGGPFLIGAAGALTLAARRAAERADAIGLDPAAQATLAASTALLLAQYRATPQAILRLKLAPPPAASARRMTIIIPVYKDVPVTKACIDSVLAHRDPARDAVLLINDASPDPGMADLLDGYTAAPNVLLLTNPSNLGFVRTANRGLATVTEGDAVLLNSDTRVFAGGLAELHAAANSHGSIGTATPLSNNATIFSYPVCNQGSDWLGDISFEQAAADALAGGRGQVFDVPTGHGFCLLITRAALDRVGVLDEAFGRGYGEENDYCQRCADLGLRNVAAAGALVEHRESVSFSTEKETLLRNNLALLTARYPDYATQVAACLDRDDLRAARWPIDTARLARAAGRGEHFVLVLRNWLGGGTRQAMHDIEARIGYGEAQPLDLCVHEDGTMRLSCGAPRLCAVFAATETAALFAMLRAAPVQRILVHQLLGFPEAFLHALQGFAPGRDMRVILHDYYILCPRVTLIDASGTFCGVAGPDRCARCLALGGPHEASRLSDLSAAAHRDLFGHILGAARHIAAPSASTAAYVRRHFATVPIAVEPHPEPPAAYRVAPRAGDARNIVLLGAIGPHKGAFILRDIATSARLHAPDLTFHIIGHTPFDDTLRALGNVSITGAYRPHALRRLAAAANGRIALFLHNWPETFSYTLSEAVQLGLVPLVPDIGAPAERVRKAGFGHVFPFPIDPNQVVALLTDFATGARKLVPEGATPAGFAAGA